MQFEGAVEQQLDRNSKFKASDAVSQHVASFARENLRKFKPISRFAMKFDDG